MTLEAAFRELDARLEQLEETFDNMLWAVVQGQGAKWSHAVLDYYDTTTQDVIGLVHEARQVSAATKGQVDLVRLRNALIAMQSYFNQVLVSFYTGVNSYERKSTLYTLKRKGRAWTTWVQGVDDALGQCPQPLYDTNQALLHCWQELVDWATLQRVPPQMQHIGPVRIDGTTTRSRQVDGTNDGPRQDVAL